MHNPPASTRFEANDILVVLGTPSQLQGLTGVKPRPRPSAKPMAASKG